MPHGSNYGGTVRRTIRRSSRRRLQFGVKWYTGITITEVRIRLLSVSGPR